MPGDLGFKYVYSPKHIEDVLKKAAELGRPPKLTFEYMSKNWLLTNAQYGAVLDLFKDMGFLDGNTPTALYAEYSNPQKAKFALAKGIKKAYPKLFEAYPKAYGLDAETLKGYFKQNTGVEASVLAKMVSTFTKLCSLADFTETENGREEDKGATGSGERSKISKEGLIPITMNIQIVIPSDATAETYDAIFSSIKKNLLDK